MHSSNCRRCTRVVDADHPALLLDPLERAMAEMAEIGEPGRAPAELREVASPEDLYLAFLYELALFVR